MNARDAALYGRLYVSNSDIAFAAYCAGVLLQKGWHGQPWERRGTIYQQQSAFTSALITAYGRPFTTSKGWPEIPRKLIPYDAEQMTLHRRLLDLRNKVYAHSDSESFSVRPWRSADFETTIIGAPPLRISKEDVDQFLAMTQSLHVSLSKRMKALRDAYYQPGI